MAARNEEIPDNLEELKKNYMLIKGAFDKLDIDLEL